MDKLATALVAESISNIKDEYKFHQMIDKSAVQDVLRDIYNGLQWKKIGRLHTGCKIIPLAVLMFASFGKNNYIKIGIRYDICTNSIFLSQYWSFL